MRSKLATVLLWWGAIVFALTYLAGSVSALADAFDNGGTAGIVIVSALLSAIPALIAGMILSER